MTEYSPEPAETGGSPAKMMAIMIAVAVLAGGFMTIALMIDRKSPDPMYDADDQSHHTQSQLEMTPDLWKSKDPVDDLDAPPVASFAPMQSKPRSPTNKPQAPSDSQTPGDSKPAVPSTKPS